MQSQTNKKTSGNDLAAFQHILDFVTNIQDHFGSVKNNSVRPINLYYRLISKMGFNDDDLILKHINVFQTFCVNNRDAIMNRDCKKIVNSRIEFSDKIYIDMKYIFKSADAITTKVIWEYILAISRYVDPTEKVDELIKNLKHESAGKESNFIADMMETLGTQINDGGSTNPMEMIGGLMNSDLFTTMVGSMNSNIQNGDLDLGKLMGSMAGLVNNVKNEIEKSDDPMMKSIFSMIPQLPPPQLELEGEKDS